MFQSPTPLAGEMLGTGWKRTGSESLSLFLPPHSCPALCSRASGFPRCSWRIRAPSPVWPRAPQVWPTGTSSCRCSVRSRGRVTRPFGLRGENQGPVPAPPLCVEPRVGPQGCQGRTHTQPLAHSVTLSLISQVVLGHEHARASPGPGIRQ